VAALTDQAIFLETLSSSLADRNFIRVTLGKPASKSDIQKLIVTSVVVRETLQLKCVERYPTKDVTKIVSANEVIPYLDSHLGHSFSSGTLFSKDFDLTIQFNRRGEPRLHRSTATLQKPDSTEHNRTKNYLVSLDRPFLEALGVTERGGRLKPTMAGKYKQISRFVEILESLLSATDRSFEKDWKIAEIGSGKGYLAFALYDYLTVQKNFRVELVGIERRQDLAVFCQAQAQALDCQSLRFLHREAMALPFAELDVLIALHACDTATDDAIYLGIRASASLIVCAPCCQHEIAPQLSSQGPSLAALHRHGLFKQRQADLVTDAARVCLLEAMGYEVDVIEFVSTEHTGKNVMLAAKRTPGIDRQLAFNRYVALKNLFQFETQRLADHLKDELATLGVVQEKGDL
jgi:hypothetical protein